MGLGSKQNNDITSLSLGTWNVRGRSTANTEGTKDDDPRSLILKRQLKCSEGQWADF